MPRGRPRKVEQGNVAEVPKPEPVEWPAPPAEEAQSLEALIAWAEAAKFAKGVVVTRVIHPDAVPRVYPGKFSGFHLERGPIGCTWSDGSSHPPKD